MREASRWRATWDVILIVLYLLLLACLLLAFVIIPVVVSKRLGPGFGVLTTAICFPIWAKLAPSPGPSGGFIEGEICTCGYLLIVIQLVVRLVVWILALFR